jgi:enoyl-CoA hydratase/carnithine racemase
MGHHLATITLNRPDKLNALTREMLDELERVAARLEQDRNVRVVLLTGSGRAFCVGADIHAWSALEPLEMWRQWTRRGHRVFMRLAQLPQPVIAALNGYTFGGGLELALAADLRVAARSILLALPEVTIGTLPGWGGTQRLPQLIGPALAKQLIFTGARVDAEMAARWGLVNDVVDDADLMERSRALAREIADNAPVAVQLAKQAIDGGLGWASPALESLAGGLAATTTDGAEGVAAFREKRDPHFRNC